MELIISAFASLMELLMKIKIFATLKIFIPALYQGKIIRLSCLVGQSMVRETS
jgi:hypothetical protein